MWQDSPYFGEKQIRLGGCLYLLFKPDMTAHFRVCYNISNSGNSKLGFTRRGVIVSHDVLKQVLAIVGGSTKKESASLPAYIMSHLNKLESLVYFINSVKITISQDCVSKVTIVDIINNTKLGLIENQFNSLIFIQEFIKNGFKLF